VLRDAESWVGLCEEGYLLTDEDLDRLLTPWIHPARTRGD
jgi:hypothetical protein